MKERWVEVASDADEKREVQLEIWLSGKGAPFVNPEAEEAYKERAILMMDAIRLKKAPQRIPVFPSAGFFLMQYAGVTMYDAMYDYDILTRAWEKYCRDFAPDA